MAETTTQISRPAPFIETMGKTFGEGVMQLGSKTHRHIQNFNQRSQVKEF